jgi:PAS domain-containing protein
VHAGTRAPFLPNTIGSVAVADPVVICLPSADVAFRAAVQSALESLLVATPGSLQARLRSLYPGALVRLRELSGETHAVWYAYRDGTYVASSEPTWHTEPGTAWVRLHPATAEILDVNDALLALLAATVDQLVGRPLFDFTYTENAEMLARQRDVVARGEVLHSIGRARALDGRDVVLEYVCYRVDGAVECWYRPASIAGSRDRYPPPATT